MGTAYSARQSTYTQGDTIDADDTNDEFDAILAAFGTSGHTHDGTAGEGGAITGLLSHTITFGKGTAGTDITITFDGESNDGVLAWMEDEDYFRFSDDILINSTEKIMFGDTASFIHQSSDGVLTIDGEATIDLNASTAVLVSNDLKLNSDAAVLGFGVDNDVTLTHVADTGVLLNSTMAIQFNDASQYINAPSATVLDINATDEVEVNATLMDVNANLDVSGTIVGASTLQATTITATTAVVPDASDGAALGTTSLEWSDLYLADGAVVGFGDDQDVTLTHVADTGLLLNSTMALQFNDASQYINAPSATVLDVNATDEIELNATLVDVNANLDVSGTYTGGGLMTTGGNIVIPDAGNIGSASDTDAIAISSGGVVTMNQIPVFSAGINVSGGTIAGTLATAAQGNVTSLGTLTTLTVDNVIINGTTIGHTSDTDLLTLASDALTVAGTIQGTTITATTAFVPDASDGAALGTTSLEFSDLYLADGAVIGFGDDQDVTITHVADTGLNVKNTHTSGNSGVGAVLTLQTGDTDVADGNILGHIKFQAPDEGAGTDAILVAAGIAAESEGDFSSSNNATSLVFQTGASETATTKMTLSSAGGVTHNPAAGGHAVFNEGGVDADLRIESSGVANMLFVDGGANTVGVGISTVTSPNIMEIWANNTGTGGVLMIKQHGTGDPAIRLSTQATTYMVGIDNSDNDDFKIDYGTTGVGAQTGLSLNTSGVFTFHDKTVARLNLKDYGEVTSALGSAGGARTIDLENGNNFTATVSASTVTWTFSNPTASDELCGFTLFLTNGGSQTVNWPAAVDWAGGTAPTLTESGLDILVFITTDGGTIWHGMVASADSKSPS
mgnify:CR=1 FL=1